MKALKEGIDIRLDEHLLGQTFIRMDICLDTDICSDRHLFGWTFVWMDICLDGHFFGQKIVGSALIWLSLKRLPFKLANPLKQLPSKTANSKKATL